MSEIRHYGVKGMKWGVRKARTGQLDDLARLHESVASGKATKAEKYTAFMNNSTVGMARRGLKGESALTAKKAREEITRLSTGKATTRDILRAYGSANLQDIRRSRRDDNNFEDRVKREQKKGMTRQDAEKSVKRKQQTAALVVAGGIAITKILLSDGGAVLSQKTAQRAQTNRNRANAAGSRGIPRKGSTGPNYAKRNKGGAYNISSL